MEKAISIKELAKEVEMLALQNGNTSIEPSVDLVSVTANNSSVQSLDFTLRKGKQFSGKATVIFKNSNVQDQTVLQLTDIEIKQQF